MQIVSALAGPSLLLPDLVADALNANARIKFTLSWLQTVERYAIDANRASFANLMPEQALVGLEADPLFAAPVAVTRAPSGIHFANAGTIINRLLQDLTSMRVAIEAGAEVGIITPAESAWLRTREEKIVRGVRLENDILPSGLVSALSRIAEPEHDTLHSLVMDMHKVLNVIGVALAEEDVAGAHVSRLSELDKERVAAFMRGLNRTAPLKFRHPGLDTSATRDQSRLIIQNDIGATDVHVLIVYVEGLRLSITYSDIHHQRLEFFQRRLQRFSWSVSGGHSGEITQNISYLATGVFEAPDAVALDAALERLGSSVTFLIDWNKARKSLRRLVPKIAAVSILDWAADHELGHCAYLEIGGDTFVGDLLEIASKATGGFYTSLQNALGEEGAVDFLHQVLRIASEELRAGRHPLAIRDLLRAELLSRVASVADRILEAVADHAALTLDLGNLVRNALLEAGPVGSAVAKRANAWEVLADHQVRRVRGLSCIGNERAWQIIASGADDAADEFEEIVFRLQFLPIDVPVDIRDALVRLAEYSVATTTAYIRLLCTLTNVRRGTSCPDTREFLHTFDKLRSHEHLTDAAEREVLSRLMKVNVDARTLYIVTAIVDSLEEAADALLHAGRLVSDHALGEWFAT